MEVHTLEAGEGVGDHTLEAGEGVGDHTLLGAVEGEEVVEMGHTQMGVVGAVVVVLGLSLLEEEEGVGEEVVVLCLSYLEEGVEKDGHNYPAYQTVAKGVHFLEMKVKVGVAELGVVMELNLTLGEVVEVVVAITN